eukprot:TRINITY_DN7208_c1_g1_i1.p1 TRINITY_DN7208_c1_g1~~TRINITY_DN7208_c1_g1_i1.p1  ORF type:complete len:355 (+),score=16.96 TRINITY_DN7208_c1_g1_i1:562-1626(+)
MNQAPAGRTCHSVIEYGDKMYSFGGMPHSTTISSVKKELCILDLKTWEWRTVSHCIPAVTEQTTVLWNDAIYLFGGYYEVEGRRSHLFEITDLDEPEPKVNLLCTNDPNRPPSRSSHTAVVWRDTMIVFGGWERVIPKNDVYIFDLKNQVWRCVHRDNLNIKEDARAEVTKMPSPRRAHTAFVIDDTMYVFGGASRVKHQDIECRTDFINHFDLVTEQWGVSRVFGDIPCPRSRCDGVVYDSLYFLSGGWNRLQHLGDLYCFSAKSLTWRRLKADMPFGIVQHAVLSWNDKLLMFGGYKCPPPPPPETGTRPRSTSTASSSSSSSATTEGYTTNDVHLYQLKVTRELCPLLQAG